MIKVWREQDFTGPYTVRPDGKITMPLVGDVQASGLTPERLGDQLKQALSNYINSPDVSVSLQTVNSKKFYITGEVNRPGEYTSGDSHQGIRCAFQRRRIPRFRQQEENHHYSRHRANQVQLSGHPQGQESGTEYLPRKRRHHRSSLSGGHRMQPTENYSTPRRDAGCRGLYRHRAPPQGLDFRSVSVHAGGERGGRVPVPGQLRLAGGGEDRAAAGAAEHGAVGHQPADERPHQFDGADDSEPHGADHHHQHLRLVSARAQPDADRGRDRADEEEYSDSAGGLPHRHRGPHPGLRGVVLLREPADWRSAWCRTW